jgi:hypothetical protein
MHKKYIWISFITIVVICAIVIPTTIVLTSKNNTSNNTVSKNDTSNNSTNPYSLPLNIPHNLTNPTNFTQNTLLLQDNWVDNTSWNITKYYYGKNNWNNTDNNTFSVTFTKNSVNPSSANPGGFLFYAQPSIFPTEEVYLSYSVKFGDNSDFEWVKGGLLPGLWIGQLGAYDGNQISNGASYRIMWRTGGQAEAYLYVDSQVNEYYELYGYFLNTIDDKIYGESVGRGFATFKSGEWNTISMHLKLNDIGKNNGILELSINQNTFKFSKMNWRDNNETINGIMMNSFFGGSDLSWATPIQQNIYFNNFTIYT